MEQVVDLQSSLLTDLLVGKIPMIYSKEIREWASLIQSNVSTAESIKARNAPQQGGSTIRALMVEMHTNGAQSQPVPVSPTQAITEKLWGDIDRKTAQMRDTLPAIIDVESARLPDIIIEDDE